MTLQEERAALQKRMDEIDAELSGFVPGWYAQWDDDGDARWVHRITSNEVYEHEKILWQHIEPFLHVANSFLPEGWRVVGQETKTLYDWSKAPEWANWAAMDEDGDVFWFEGKPERLGRGWRDDSWYTEKRWELARRATALYQSVPWDQSLEQRPGITQ